MRGARGSSCARSSAPVECSDSASAGLTRPCGRRSNTRRSPTVEKTRFLCPIAALGAEQLDGLEHVVQVVRRLAHAHEHDLPRRPAASGRAPPARRSRRCRAGAAGRRGRSCRTRSPPRSRPGSRRTGRRAAAARSRRSGRRPVRPAGARSRPSPACSRAQARQRGQLRRERGQRGAQSPRAGSPRPGGGRCPAAAPASRPAARAARGRAWRRARAGGEAEVLDAHGRSWKEGRPGIHDPGAHGTRRRRTSTRHAVRRRRSATGHSALIFAHTPSSTGIPLAMFSARVLSSFSPG